MDDTRTPVHAYTEDQRATVADAWRRMLDSHVTRTDDGSFNVDRVDDDTLSDLIDRDGGPEGVGYYGDPYGTVRLVIASYSDYGGASYDHANVRTLAGHPGVSVSDAGMGGECAWIAVGELPTNGDPGDIDAGIGWLVELADIVDGLADYPCIDESAWSELETELQDAAWDEWLASDVRSSLDNMIQLIVGDTDEWIGWEEYPTGPGVDADADRAEVIREAYYRNAGEYGEWTCETATSATNLRHDDTVRRVMADVYGVVVADCAHVDTSHVRYRADGTFDPTGATRRPVAVRCTRPAEYRGAHGVYCDRHAHAHGAR